MFLLEVQYSPYSEYLVIILFNDLVLSRVTCVGYLNVSLFTFEVIVVNSGKSNQSLLFLAVTLHYQYFTIESKRVSAKSQSLQIRQIYFSFNIHSFTLE